MVRAKHLRLQLGWTQSQMAGYLRCAQATVARMELGQPESGAVSVLLDQLADKRDGRKLSSALPLPDATEAGIA